MTASEDKKQLFGQSVQKCMTLMFSLARKMTGNAADAEDLVAECVLKAWTAFDSLDDPKKFKAWICRILHNCYISQYRKKAVRPIEITYKEESDSEDGDAELIHLLLEQSDAFLLWWANPEKEFSTKLVNDDIFLAIDSLPEQFREVILLVNVEGFTYDQAADMLNVPSGTVRSRMKRGRTLLQKSLWQHGVDAGLIHSPSEENS